MKLDDRIRELITVGASVGANCHSCLEYRFGKAGEQGVPDGEIALSDRNWQTDLSLRRSDPERMESDQRLWIGSR
jgi:hypothetical protein